MGTDGYLLARIERLEGSVKGLLEVLWSLQRDEEGRSTGVLTPQSVQQLRDIAARSGVDLPWT